MVKEFGKIMQEIHILDLGKIVNPQVMEYIFGRIKVSIKVNF